MKKNIISLFKEEGLSITIEINLVETDFSDVTFNLDTGKYFPFRKPNKNPIYIHAKSNNPSSIIKDLPNMVNKRLSDLSCNEQEFNKAKPLYENALQDNGFNTSIKYAKDEAKSNQTTEIAKLFGSTRPLAKMSKLTSASHTEPLMQLQK